MSSTLDPEVQVKNFINQAVQHHWDQHQSVYMLSNLGQKLKREIPMSNTVLVDGLSDYLRQNPVIQLVQFPCIAQKIGAVPLSVTVPDDPTELFKSLNDAKSTHSGSIYNQDFWNAFIHGIDKGNFRVVTTEPGGTLTIKDVKQDEFVKRPETYTIQESDLTPKGLWESDAEKAAVTKNKITTWLVSNSLRSEIFVKTGGRFKPKDSNDRVSILLSAFAGLPKDDLARINIPLDILSKLVSSK